ncbi:synaptic vesicle glycoprotein 2B [Eurytemora carolleeae]|uniref:synaptic vesicle glycoprotein 2B n=1 Tax=Eurytemora carolleeae TaxID=1294199 RepID=UPI000C794F74|nr:synaptic vesicle glycoprotein 2B [Eurytemora carolleeae]|eukprot:XP_023330505.1 synaptic vesicle glycoprotein 2B-like [Eurytemora affinis]
MGVHPASIENPKRKDKEEYTEFEDAIKECGYGKFHYILLMVCGWANASDAIEILCISFLLPSAECDLNLSAERKGWLSAILFVGMMVGGYVWGALGDSIGRRSVLINAMIVNALAGIGSSFAQEFYLFLTLRFISGVGASCWWSRSTGTGTTGLIKISRKRSRLVMLAMSNYAVSGMHDELGTLGVGGSIPVVWTYFAEFQPANKRGGALSFLASFWMVGNIAVAGMAWVVIPHELGWNGDGFKFNSWRIFVVMSAIPSLLVALSLMFLPESPKFLLAKGHQDKALEVLRNMYSMNTGKPAAKYPVSQLVQEDISPHIKSASGLTGSWTAVLKETMSNTAQLFTSKPLLRVTTLMIIIHFAIQFGYYGLWLWFPELFNKLEKYYAEHPDDNVYICEVVGTSLNTTNTITESCEERGPPDNQVFINSFIISLSAGPSNLWTILCMDKLGRKFFLCLSMVLSGGSAFLIYLVNSTTMNLVLSCVFGAVSTMGFNSLDCLGIELFPTRLRGTAMAITLVSARIGAILGNLVFGYLVESHCAVPIIMVAGVAGGIF